MGRGKMEDAIRNEIKENKIKENEIKENEIKENEIKENEIKDIPLNKLIGLALKARERAYAPYSAFCVGAAVLTGDERIYTGCNIENASYGATVCAERTAIFKAVSEGRGQCKALAVVGSPKGESITQYASPCGMCRQVMREFAAEPSKFIVIIAKSMKEYKIFSLEELLPESFGPTSLIQNRRGK